MLSPWPPNEYAKSKCRCLRCWWTGLVEDSACRPDDVARCPRCLHEPVLIEEADWHHPPLADVPTLVEG